MKKILLALMLLLPVTADAAQSESETQATKNARAYQYLRRAFPATYTTSLQDYLGMVVTYVDTTERDAATPQDGTIGYEYTTDTLALRAAGAWVAISNASTFTGANGETLANGTNDVFTFLENGGTTEDLLLTASANLWTWSSTTSATMAITPALALAGDLTLSGGASGLTIGAASSSILLNSSADNSATGLLIGPTGQLNLLTLDTTDDQETVIVTGTTATTAFHVDVGETLFDEGVDAAIMATALDKLRFCGNGPNATTATYIGPVLESDYGTDMSFTGAGCDAKDNTTEGTADLALDTVRAFKPVAMTCFTLCGTNDTMTVQLRDDTANVTGMTCNITLTGSAANCTVRDPSPATVAANSQIAVRVVNSTDDNCSASDLECYVWITY